MAGNLVKKVMLKIVADDGDSEAKLDKITAKAEQLGREHPEIKVRIDSAAATAKVDVLRRELRQAAKEADEKSGLGYKLGLLGSRASTLTGLSDVMGVFNSEASMGSRIMSGLGAATGLLEAPLSGAVVGVGAMASGLVAAGLGAGIFGLVAKSAIGQVEAAAKKGKAALDKLPPAEQRMAAGIKLAKNEWTGFVKAASPGVAGVIAAGIGLIPKALALARPFLGPVETALTHIVASVKTKIGSGSFISEIRDFAKASGPDLQKVAAAAGHVAMGVLGILHAFLPMSGTVLGGLDKLTAKFEHWGQTLTQHSGFQSLMSMAKADMPYVIKIVKNLGSAFVNLGGSMTGLSTFSNSKALLQLATPISQLVNWLSKANPGLLRMGLYALAAHSAFGKVSGAMSGLKTGLGDLNKGVNLLGKFGGAAEDAGKGAKIAAAATKVWTGIQAAFDIVMDANPVMLIVIAIGLLVAGIVLLVVKCKPFREFWIKLWKDAQKIFGDVVDWIKTHWKLLPAILLGPIGLAVTIVLTHFTQIRNGVVRLVGDVISFFRRLPGRILSVLSHLGSDLFTLGKNAIMGLVHGAESLIGDVTGIGQKIGSALESGFKDVLSIFSPSRVMFRHGQMVALGLIGGMDSMRAPVTASAARMAHAATPGYGAYRGGGAGGAGQEVVLRIEGTNQGLIGALVLALRNDIRVHGGGDVQKYLGH